MNFDGFLYKFIPKRNIMADDSIHAWIKGQIDESIRPVIVFVNDLESFWKSKRLHFDSQVTSTKDYYFSIEYSWNRSRAFGLLKKRNFMDIRIGCEIQKNSKMGTGYQITSTRIEVFIPYHFPRDKENELKAQVLRFKDDLKKRFESNEKSMSVRFTPTWGYVGIWTGYVGMD